MIKKDKNENWFKRHPILTVFLALFLIWLIFSSGDQQTSNYEAQSQIDSSNYESSSIQEQIQECNSNWSCSSWSGCNSGTQTRSCIDSNNCGTNLNKPSTIQSCTQDKKWNEIITFQSSSSKKTDTFIIKGEKWKFTWFCEKTNDYDGMNIGVYKPGSEMYTEFLFMQKCSNIEETTFVYKGNSEYYFDIMIANVDSWKIKVEEWN
mgnify:CR=1 FL=1